MAIPSSAKSVSHRFGEHAKQAKALSMSRGSVHYLPRPVSAVDLAIMRRPDRLHLEYPFAGSRMLRGLLSAEGARSAGVT